MAYDIKNISPLDLKKSVSIGVKIPFTDPAVFTRVYTTKEQLRYNIINFLLTDKRERIFSPSFGAGIRRRIFEQITQTTAEEIRTSLTTQLESYFSNVRVDQLIISTSPDTNTITISLSYTVLNTNQDDVLMIDLQN
jgi:phage baseplate assembly protein W